MPKTPQEEKTLIKVKQELTKKLGDASLVESVVKGVAEAVQTGVVRDNMLAPDNRVSPLIEDVMKQYPPKKGNMYIDGFWLVPWVLRPWGVDLLKVYKIADKIKMMIANNPECEAAIAYRMGVEDERKGKTEAQKKSKLHKVTDGYLKERGLPTKVIDSKVKKIEEIELDGQG